MSHDADELKKSPARLGKCIRDAFLRMASAACLVNPAPERACVTCGTEDGIQPRKGCWLTITCFCSLVSNSGKSIWSFSRWTAVITPTLTLLTRTVIIAPALCVMLAVALTMALTGLLAMCAILALTLTATAAIILIST